MALLAVDLHYEERLLRVSDLEVVVLQEVLSNADLLAISCLESGGDRSLLEVNVLNEVGLLVAVVADNGLALELEADPLLLVSDLLLSTDLMNA